MAFSSVYWLVDGAQCFCVKSYFLCIYFYIYLFIFNLLFWTHHLALSFHLPSLSHWNDTINKNAFAWQQQAQSSPQEAVKASICHDRITRWLKPGLVFLEGVPYWEIVGSLSSCSAQLGIKSSTGATPLGTLCRTALLLPLSGAGMQPGSVGGMGFYPGVGKLQRELLRSWAVFQTLFPFPPTSLCNPCFKALKARDYSGNAKTGWHIEAFADSVREDNKICISFVSDSLIFFYTQITIAENNSDPCW